MPEKRNKYWDKRAIERLTAAEKSSEAYIISIKKMYNQAYKDINKELETVYKNYAKETGLDVQKLKELLTRSETKKTWKQMKKQGLDEYIKDNYKSRISRLEQIQAQIYGKAKQIYPKEELAQTMCYEGVINESYYKTIYDTQIGTGYDFSFNKLDQKTLTKVLNEGWSSKNYSERIWGNTDILAENLSEILGGALISGQSIEKTSKQIRDRFNVAKYYSERLVRTETNHFNNEADALAYEEMGIDKYVFVATLDSRTSKACQDMDNEVIEYKERKSGFNFPPLHPNCRSKTRGYLGEEAEKMIMRRAIDPETKEIKKINNVSYKKWGEKNGLIKPKTLKDNDTSLKKRIGFYDDRGLLTFIPKNAIITNTKIIAGDKVSMNFRSAQRFADTYGGKSSDYSKVVGKIESDKYIFDIHFVKDKNNNEYEFKIKNKTLKGDKNDRKN